MAESFFATLETELLDRHTFPTRDQARSDGVRLHRRLLQPTPAALDHRIPLTHQLRKERPNYHLDRQAENCPQKRGNSTTAASNDPYQSRGARVGQHVCQGSPRRDGRPKKGGPQAIGKSRGGWNTKIHLVAADAQTPVEFTISPGQDHDGPHGRALLKRLGRPQQLQLFLVADRAYEGDETRQVAHHLGYTPIIPPKATDATPGHTTGPSTSDATK